MVPRVNLFRRVTSAATASVSACAIGLLGLPAVPAFGADAQVHISYPAEGQAVGTGPLTVTGSVQVGAGTMTQVIYAVDVSGSTASPAGLDCNGDGSVTAALDDYNQDGSVGDTLDCEISGILSLNAALRAVPDADARIRVGIVGFGSLAAQADMDPGATDGVFVKPGDTRDGNDIVPRVNAVAGSLTRGTIGLETLRTVGTGTDFQRPLDTAAAAFTADANKWIFLISDGQASAADTSKLTAAGIKVRTFAVGAAATCQAGSPLDAIAVSTGDACVRVDDPSRLRTDIVSGTPSGITSVTVQLDGNAAKAATVDAIGNFSAAVGDVGTGAHTAKVVVELADGTRKEAVRRFTGTAGTRYVAIGDSFAAGEGVEPYVDQKVDKYLNVGRGGRIPLYQQNPAFLCHRSTKGWPLKIKEVGASKPVAESGGAFTFAACSGARLVNVDTAQQTKEYRDKKTAIPLQNTVLGTDADLVTMTFGGNDVGFVPIVTHCVAHYNCWEDTFVTVNGKAVSLDAWTKLRIALVQNELDGLYQQVRGRVRTDTRIVVATYPRLLKIGNRLCTEGAVLPQGERQWLADRVDDFDDVVAVRAKRSNIDVADVREAFQDHAICDGDNYITGARIPRHTDLGGSPTSAASFHPNEKGTTAYATVVSEVLAKPASTSPLALAAAPGSGASTGAASGANRVAAPSAEAVEAARKAEETAVQGPARTTVSGPVQAPKQAQVRQLAPAGGPGDKVIAGYPAEVVAAVKATEFTDVVVGDGAALKLLPSCPSDVVPGEHVPFSAPGFKPGSTVEAQVTWEGAKPVTKQVTVDAEGRARAWIRVPTDVPVDRPSALRLSGKGPSGGTVLGYAPLTATAAADCRQLVVDAGLLDEPKNPPSSGPDESTPGGGATTSAPPRAGGPLPTTGPGGWLLISAAVGAVMVLAGAGLLFLVRRRRAVDA